MISHGHLYDHKTLGVVVAISVDETRTVRVVTHDAFRSAPWREISTRQGGRIDAEVHEVDVETLKSRATGSAMSVDEFMRTHRTPGFKVKPLPKPRKLPRLSAAAFAKLANENGLRVHSW